MEPEQCTSCGEEIEMTGFACISSTFEQEDDKFIFFGSAGYDEEGARKFVNDVRSVGHFAVMMKVEDIPKEKSFTNLLDKDIT